MLRVIHNGLVELDFKLIPYYDVMRRKTKYCKYIVVIDMIKNAQHLAPRGVNTELRFNDPLKSVAGLC